VFGGTVSGVIGAWTYDPDTRVLKQVADFRLGSASWSGDGSRIVGQRPTGDPLAGTSEITVLTRPANQ
jgi:hypothetical protein